MLHIAYSALSRRLRLVARRLSYWCATYASRPLTFTFSAAAVAKYGWDKMQYKGLWGRGLDRGCLGDSELTGRQIFLPETAPNGSTAVPVRKSTRSPPL